METRPLQSSVETKEKIKLRILYADDDESIRSVIERLLRRKYSHVEVVENGQALIDRLSEDGEGFDIVLTDNQMPKKTGLEALQEIRQTSGLENLFVIVLTTDDTGNTQSRVEELGGVYVSKPFDITNLYIQIEKLVTSKKEKTK